MEHDLVTDDVIEIVEPVWQRGVKRPIGERHYVAKIERESYGDKTGQHTFSLRVTEVISGEGVEVGKLIRRMGRNVYPNAFLLERDEDKFERRAAAKHDRAVMYSARALA